jgi:hypothetical protein
MEFAIAIIAKRELVALLVFRPISITTKYSKRMAMQIAILCTTLRKIMISQI